MRLRFIGADGSLGLKHGQTYDIKLNTFGKYVIATIKTGWISDTICPYSSMQALAKNWEI